MNEMNLSEKRNVDCLPCRLVTGFGVIGMGIYLYSQSKSRSNVAGRYTMYGLSLATIFIGSARLFNMDLLKSK